MNFDECACGMYLKGACVECERAQVIAFLQECPVAATSPAQEAIFRMALRAAAVMIQEDVHTKEWEKP